MQQTNKVIKQKETIGISGHFEMTVRDLNGDVIEHYEDPNVYLNQGKQIILRALTIRDTNEFSINTIKIGDDVGTGTVMEPEQPDADLTEVNQDVVYTIPTEEFFIDYPTQNSVRFFATVNGAQVMAEYPDQPNVVYTSAALYTMGSANEKAIAYKRFTPRTLSNLISVDISWTLTVN